MTDLDALSPRERGLVKRDDLPERERAVSDVLDDYLMRKLGVMSSNSDWDLFLDLLHAEGYDVTKFHEGAR